MRTKANNNLLEENEKLTEKRAVIYFARQGNKKRNLNFLPLGRDESRND